MVRHVDPYPEGGHRKKWHCVHQDNDQVLWPSSICPDNVFVPQLRFRLRQCNHCCPRLIGGIPVIIDRNIQGATNIRRIVWYYSMSHGARFP